MRKKISLLLFFLFLSPLFLFTIIFLYKKGFLLKELFLASLRGEGALVLSEADFNSLTEEIELLRDGLKEQQDDLEIIDSLVEEIDLLTQRSDDLNDRISLLKNSIIDEVRGMLDEKIEENKEKEGLDNSELLCDIKETEPLKSQILINEVAWMGNLDKSEAEWIELKNASNQEINLKGWKIQDKDQKIKIFFTEEDFIPAKGFYLLEKNDDNSVIGIKADKIYTGVLNNQDEVLYLFDEDCQLRDVVKAIPNWPAGDNTTKRTMERKIDLSWQTSFSPGGTPKKENSQGYLDVLSNSSLIPRYSGGGGGSQSSQLTTPQISLSFSPEDPVNKEIEVKVSVDNLKKDVSYDIKISIEKEQVLSDIYNEKEGKWQNSYNYLIDYFKGERFEGQFKLKIKDEKQDFRGEADLLVKIRENGKSTNYSYSEKINIRGLEFKIKVELEGEGEIEPSLNEYFCQEGEEIKIKAVPKEGWIFDKWTGDFESQDSEIILICQERDKTITAHFIEKKDQEDNEGGEDNDGEEDDSNEASLNLLLNSSFEEGEAIATYWQQGSNVSRSDEQAHTGSWSVKIAEIAQGYSSTRQITSHNINILSEKKYSLSGWYYLKDPGEGSKAEDYFLFIRVQWDGSSTGQRPSSGFEVPKFNEWTFFEFKDISKEGASFANVVITVRRDNEIPTDIYFDDISLKEE